MTRGYVARVAAWAVLVAGLAGAAGHWFARTMPAEVTEREDRPKNPPAAGAAAADTFPALTRYVNRPLEWARENWLFLSQVAVLLLIGWGQFARPVGAFDLIYTEGRGYRFLNGLVLGLVFGALLFTAYITTADLTPWPVGADRTLFPVDRALGQRGEADAIRRAGNFMLVTWVPVLAAMYAPWVARPAGPPGVDRFPALGLGLAASVGLIVAVVVGGWEAVGRGDPAGGWRALFARAPGAADGRIPPADYALHLYPTALMLVPAVVLVGLGAAAKAGRVGSPVWVIGLSLWLFNALYGFVGFHFAGLQYVLLAAGAAVVVVANARHPYKLMLPNMGPEYAAARARSPATVQLDRLPTARHPLRLLSADDLLGKFCEDWQRARGADTKPKLVVVATSGGGIRSAVWTGTVLDGLERAMGGADGPGGFGRHVRLVTGASGGMVAGALYAAARVRPPAGKSLARLLGEDSLWPTLQGMLLADLPAAFTPFHRSWDRGFTLERAWHRNVPAADGGPSPFRATFAELMPAERAGVAPSVVFSPVLVEDGRRVLISNLDLGNLAAEHAPILTVGPDGDAIAPRSQLSRSAVEFFRLFPDAHGRFEVGTAARLSATFPFVSPAVNLPAVPARRMVDAGYFDNYGVGVAAQWLFRNRQAVRRWCGGVAVVEVRAFPLEQAKNGFDVDGPPGGVGDVMVTTMAGVSTPAEALATMRGAGAYFRNDQLLGMLDGEFNAGRGADPFFVRVPIECPGAAALSWTLTSWDRDQIVSHFSSAEAALTSGVAEPVTALTKWFGTGGR